MLTRFMVLVGVAMTTTVAHAQIPAVCADKVSQAEMNRCAGDLLASANRELDGAYAALMAKLDARTKPMTRDAQRAWLAFRDKECVSQTGGGPAQPGTIWPMLYAECQVALTLRRTKDLAAQSKCPGGDLSCSD